ncbi:MAG TPA: DUF6232 family protein [Natronosporangium sp.]|nr:DUF6232 family protein [Natronosporangium sp.]
MYGSSNLAPLPDERMNRRPARRPIVLYRDWNTLVTTETFWSEDGCYPVEELAFVERVESGSRFRGRSYELRALFRGQRVRLFRTRNQCKFGQVCRALTRAQEYAGLV